MRKLALIPMGALLVGVVVIAEPERHRPPAYQLGEVGRGEAITRVIAAGTVQPIVSVVVGSQVSGQIQDILVDHNDAVTRGQPIARLDPSVFATRLEQASAEVGVAVAAVGVAHEELAKAEAGVHRAMAEQLKATADSKRYQITVGLTQRRLDRKTALVKSGTASASDADDARAAHDTALAESTAAAAQVASQQAAVQEAQTQLAVMRSRISHAEAQVRRSEAARHQAEADLERTVIRAPLNGIVIDRGVTAGQTVAASFQAPNLFTIGDLREVSIEIAADEADIGGLRVGQNATFSVDAYADKTFRARISQVRKSPHAKDSVVTYIVVATAKNDGLLLLPGMTAKVEITTGDVPDALQVPNAALRYRPKGMPHPAGSHVWIFDDSGIRPVPVRIGVSVAGNTEILAGALAEGQKVVLADGAAAARDSIMSRGLVALAGAMQP